MSEVPSQLSSYELTINDDGRELVYTYDTKVNHTGITALLGELQAAGIRFNDLNTSQSSLQDIFVDLVRKTR
jgi:ABC-2 type transport system ATP-binding protein